MTRASEIQDELLSIGAEILQVQQARAAFDVRMQKERAVFDEKENVLKGRHLALLTTLEGAIGDDGKDDDMEGMRRTLRRIRRNSVRETVMGAIAGGALTVMEIAAATGLDPKQVSTALQDAKRPNVGLVEGPDEKRRWRLTTIGAADLEYRRERGAD